MKKIQLALEPFPVSRETRRAQIASIPEVGTGKEIGRAVYGEPGSLNPDKVIVHRKMLAPKHSVDARSAPKRYALPHQVDIRREMWTIV